MLASTIHELESEAVERLTVAIECLTTTLRSIAVGNGIASLTTTEPLTWARSTVEEVLRMAGVEGTEGTATAPPGPALRVVE